MSEQNNAPDIMERINQVLTGDAQKNALDLAAFLRENDIWLEFNKDEDSNLAMWCGAVGGIVGNSIGFLLINGDENFPGPWTFWFNSCDFEGSKNVDEEFKNAIWAFTSPCGKCNPNWEKCRGSDKRTILGKEFEEQCHSPLTFCNPSAETLKNMKRLLIYLKPEIDSIQAEIERERANVETK